MEIKNNETGATSILVLFMMIVLITMGTFAITTAHSNITFSERVIDWNENYYDLDTKAEEFLFSLDEILYREAKNAKNDAETLSEYNTLYKEYAKEAILEMPYEIEIEEGIDIFAHINFNRENEIAHLLVSLCIKTPTKEYPERYEIVTWKEWQEPFSYDEEIEFWDGNFEDLEEK